MIDRISATMTADKMTWAFDEDLMSITLNNKGRLIGTIYLYKPEGMKWKFPQSKFTEGYSVNEFLMMELVDIKESKDAEDDFAW